MGKQGDQDARGQTTLAIQLLGGFHITCGEGVIAPEAWGRRNAGHIVKLLALAPGYTLHREEIMDHLWPDRAPDAAANNLRYNLHIARRLLRSIVPQPDEILTLNGQQIQLAPAGRIRTDIDDFEQALSFARASDALAHWETALEHYQGDLLPEDRNEDWAVSRRESLREMFLQGLAAHARVLEATGDVSGALATLERLASLDAAREEAHVNLMRLYALRGQRQLALRQYGRLREALHDELDVDPEPVTQQLYQAILTGRFPAEPDAQAPETVDEARAPGRHNLPEAQDSFIGRQREMQEVKGLLNAARFLSLIGSGGVGKTRLALEIARAQVRQSSDDVWLVDLSALTSAASVPVALATTLGIHETSGDNQVTRLAEALRAESMLLILDNCEHLVDAVAGLATALLAACPGVRVLATSREPMRVSGEVTYRIPSLTLPDSGTPDAGDPSSHGEAVQLFTHRIRRHQRDFRLSADNIHAVTGICRDLDGIPLGIELAAARAGTLGVEHVAARLGEALHLLAASSDGTPERHQTLHHALDWSYQLLDEREQRVFERLSVFTGGWDLPAAEAAATDPEISANDLLHLLASLVDKSLVTLEALETGLRYRMLAPVRQYGVERLRLEGREYDARQRHAEYIAEFVTTGEMKLRGASQAVWISRYELEHDNLRAALFWSLEAAPHTALRIAANLGRFWYIRSYGIEGRSMLRAALDAAPDGDQFLRGKSLYQAGILADEAGDHAEAERLLDEALLLVRGTGDMRVAMVLNSLGAVARARGNLERAETLFEESLAIRRASGDQIAVNLVLNNLATVAWSRGDLDRAETLFNETLALDRASGDEWAVALTNAYLGRIAWARGKYAESRDIFHESMELAFKVGDQGAGAEGIEGIAGALGRLGQPHLAARFWGAAEAQREKMNVPVPAPERAFYDEVIASVQPLVGKDTFANLWAEGRDMELDDVLACVEQAVRESQSQPPVSIEPADPVETLTAREEEIVALITREHTNQQIAAALGIAPRTVDTHVSRILRKLNVASRTEVAAKLLSD